MKIIILTYGSRGDVQPFLALALGLQNAGHTVKLAAPHRFSNFVQSRKVPFIPLAGDPEIISQRLNDAGSNPFGMIRAISNYTFTIADQVIRQVFTACDDAEMIIHSFLFTTGGHSIARKLGIPDISIQTFPIFAPTRAVPPVSMSNLPPGLLSYFFHWLITQIFWYGGNVGFGRLRRNLPDEYDMDLFWPFKVDENRIRTPLVFACSPTIISRPDDWSVPNIYIPGYLFLDEADVYQPPPALVEFLSAGPPPVCVTFGSTIHGNPERIYSTILNSLKKTGNRAIFLSGWSDLQHMGLPENVLEMDSIPHDWLLPHCKSIVHHGGAGTIAAGMRAGIPNVVVPSAADQPFWGMRVHALGVGPQPIPVRKLTVENLSKALILADADAVHNNAQAIGRKIRGEDGVGKMVKLVEKYVAKWQETPESANL